MSKDTVLASAIANIPHMVAFDTVMKQRLTAIELDKLLVYIIDTVDAKALPYLADQLDVLGYKGMKLATTEAQQREIIKRAIELKRYKGTPWAIKESLKAIGYPDAVLIEGVGEGENGWATFRIDMFVATGTVSSAMIGELVQMIEEYKNERSHLEDISFTIVFEADKITITDDSNEFENVADGDTVFAGGDFRHNGATLRDGSRNYSQDTDVLQIEIQNV